MSTCDKYPSVLQDRLEEGMNHLSTLLRGYRTKIVKGPVKQSKCGNSALDNSSCR